MAHTHRIQLKVKDKPQIEGNINFNHGDEPAITFSQIYTTPVKELEILSQILREFIRINNTCGEIESFEINPLP